MKLKNVIVYMLLLFTMGFMILGCSEKKEVQDKGNEFYIGMENVSFAMKTLGNQIGINIPIIYKGELEEIEVTSLEGEGIDNLDTKLVDDTFEDIQSMEYEGYHLHLMGLIFTKADNFTFTRVDGIHFKVGDKEEYYKFEQPIVVEGIEQEENDLSERLMADGLMTGNELDAIYVWEVQNDISIQLLHLVVIMKF